MRGVNQPYAYGVGGPSGTRTHTSNWQGIFALLHVAMAAINLRCSPEYVITISLLKDLGSWSIFSTHLFSLRKNLARRSLLAFAVLASFYSRNFLPRHSLSLV